MEKILTITVPAYNAEKYLETNLSSFCVPELLPKLEVLIVNDGSTDETQVIAEKYCAQYPDTFRLINKENGGHGSCINTGIEQATGRYFKVVDADDWVVEPGLSELVNFLEGSYSDIVYSGFLWAYDKGQADVNDFETEAEYDEPFAGVEYGKEYIFDDVAEECYIKMHNLTIKTAALKEMPGRMDEHCYYVDYEYITYPIPLIETVTFLESSVYRYRLGNEGQSMNIEKQISLSGDMDRVMDSMLAFYERCGNDILCSMPKKAYIAGIIARLVASRVKVYLCLPKSGETEKELKEFDKNIKENYPQVYAANQNSAVKMLRASGFLLYGMAAKAAKKKYL